MNLRDFEKLSKDEQQAVLLAMKPEPGAAAGEQARFETLRRIALGQKLTEEEQAGIEMGELYNHLKGGGKQ